MTMPAKEAAKVLREHNAWRRGEVTNPMPYNPRMLGEAIDTAVAALESVAQQSPPSTDSHQPAADSRHPRERVLAQDAARGNFRRPNNDHQNDGA